MIERPSPSSVDGPAPRGAAVGGVQVDGLHVRFGTHTAVESLDLVVEPGTSIALIGRNGAGKSTTLRVLGGVLPPTRGAVRIAGIDAVADPSAARAVVGYCPDVGGLIPRATVREHLALSARMRALPAGWTDEADRLLDAFDLTAAADRVTAGFSHGMSRRTAVVLAALHRPPVLLLDEPFDGVDPLGVDATMAVIDDLVAAGSTVLVSTHLLPLAVRACERAVVLSGGRCVADTDAAGLAGDEGAALYRSLIA